MRRLVLLGILCAGLLLAQDSSIEQAWKLAGTGHTEEAVQLLDGVVQRHPDNPDARLLLGSLFSEEGRYEGAITQLSKAVQLRPQSAEARNALGEAYNSFGNHAKARQVFEQAVAVDPALVVAQTNLARCLIDAQELDAAAAHLDHALKTGGRDADDVAIAHYLRAKVYTARSNPRAAATQLQAAVSLRPEFAAAWSDLGESRKILLDQPRALAAFRRAVQLAPNDSVAQYRLGEEYLVQQQPRLAIPPLQQADRLSPADQSTLNALLRALRLDGQMEAADKVKQQLSTILDRREVSAEDELSAIKLNNEGARLERSRDLRRAMESYRAAVKLSPHSVPMRVNYAAALLRLGEWTMGLDELHNSLLMDPTNSKIKVALRDALAQAPAAMIPRWSEYKGEAVSDPGSR
jgi:tetratricopeptide (TPR) repeat protein